MTNITGTPAPRPAGLRAGDQVQTAAELREIWETDPRWDGVERTYTAEDVIRIRGSVREESTLAHRGALKDLRKRRICFQTANHGEWGQ
ncbi:MAG: hypothetical protein Q7T55_00190 [Solirubrobacteraceae bacterium]|nr:hypothetical protein [Solirubrobacteraceae bacterium]